MFLIVFILVLAVIATWNAEPIFALTERLNLPILMESIIVLGLVGGIPALAIFLGALVETFLSERRHRERKRRRAQQT